MYRYITNCVNSTAKAINDMVYNNSREIAWRTFRKHVSIEDLQYLFPYYSYGGRDERLHIKDDWAVTFNKSTYKGKPCYYLVHSAIEYIFVEPEEDPL